MKLLVIGPQLSGKTTLTKYLREHTNTVVSEIDEEILKANNGEWPTDNQHKDSVLIPAIYDQIAKQENIIFFANHFEPISLLENFKAHGFRVVRLILSQGELAKRNENRVKHEGYEDATQWLEGQLANHQELIDKNLIDAEIDAERPTVDIVQDLITKFKLTQ